jgi:hypothetical protein
MYKTMREEQSLGVDFFAINDVTVETFARDILRMRRFIALFVIFSSFFTEPTTTVSLTCFTYLLGVVSYLININKCGGLPIIQELSLVFSLLYINPLAGQILSVLCSLVTYFTSLTYNSQKYVSRVSVNKTN